MTRNSLFRIALLALAGVPLLPAGAQAGWRGGLYFGLPPVVIAPPPPVYYYPPPPVFVGPPPVYEAPPAAFPQSYGGPPPPGTACYAGQWVCPLDRPTASGDSCACPTASGRLWGRAN